MPWIWLNFHAKPCALFFFQKKKSVHKKKIVNEFADNSNSLLNKPVIERDSEPHIIPTETSL